MKETTTTTTTTTTATETTITLAGQIVSMPTIRSSKKWANYHIANYRLEYCVPGGEKQQIRCVAFGRMANYAEDYLEPGVNATITGKIQDNSFVSRSGETISYKELVVDSQEVIEQKDLSRLWRDNVAIA